MERHKDALALLKSDHENVKNAFDKFKNLGPKAYKSKKKLADGICSDLEVHTKIEEEVFYPAFRNVVKGAKPIADEAKVEHDNGKQLIEEIKSMNAEDDLFDAKVTVLSEYIQHHVKEEEEEMFPLIQKTSIDLVDLGERMAERKKQLTG